MSELLTVLCHANRNLGATINLLGAEVGIPTADDLATVLTELLRVGEALQRHPQLEHDAEVVQQIRLYRYHLEQLRERMPSLQAQLLVERARLEAERSHLASSSAWAEVCRGTR